MSKSNNGPCFFFFFVTYLFPLKITSIVGLFQYCRKRIVVGHWGEEQIPICSPSTSTKGFASNLFYFFLLILFYRFVEKWKIIQLWNTERCVVLLINVNFMFLFFTILKWTDCNTFFSTYSLLLISWYWKKIVRFGK